MHDYIFLSVGRVGSSTDLIVQHVEYISPNEKRNVLLDLIGTVEVCLFSLVVSADYSRFFSAERIHRGWMDRVGH